MFMFRSVGCRALAALCLCLAGFNSVALATPLITAITQNGTALNANAPIATSASSRLPQPEGLGTQGALADEAYVYVTRTAEWTAVRTDPTTNLLNTAATGNLQQFPSYLNGIEYVQFPNENRGVADYSVDMTFANSVVAYLFIDNRVNGAATGTKANTTDPTTNTGNTAWIDSDGWKRVNTGFMPNGQADYIGFDEGATVASADLRTHTTSGLVAGSGNGLNNFAAIYTKTFPAGLNAGVTKAFGSTSVNFYGFAVAPVPEPSSIALSLIAAGGFAAICRRRSGKLR
jgi:hypothetical protein